MDRGRGWNQEKLRNKISGEQPPTPRARQHRLDANDKSLFAYRAALKKYARNYARTAAKNCH